MHQLAVIVVDFRDRHQFGLLAVGSGGAIVAIVVPMLQSRLLIPVHLLPASRSPLATDTKSKSKH